MKLHSKIALFIIATAMMACIPVNADACSCMRPRPPCEEYGRANAIFIGLVTDASVASNETGTPGVYNLNPEKTFRFTVEESFKGISSAEVDIVTGSGGGDCGYSFLKGERYLVYAFRGPKSEKLSTNICTRTTSLVHSNEDLAYLRGLSKAKPGGTIFGKVERYTGDREYGPYELAGPMAGVKVLITGQGARHEIVTDKDGRYQVSGLQPGGYDVRAELPDYLAGYTSRSWMNDADSRLATVGDRGCAEENIAVELDGRISGRVVDSEERPVPGLLVDLVKADSVGKDFREIRSRYVESDDEGRFEFRMLPPGRYVLGVNIHKAPDSSAPYLRTYFPGVSDTSRATIISIGDGTKLKDYDLRLPPRRVERDIKGIVLWSDGRAVAEATVSLDLSEYPGWLMMTYSVKTDDEGRFLIKGLDGFKYSLHAHIYQAAPTNRRAEARPVEVVASENVESVKLIIPAPASNPNKSDPRKEKKP
jgi:hypothetical protein